MRNHTAVAKTFVMAACTLAIALFVLGSGVIATATPLSSSLTPPDHSVSSISIFYRPAKPHFPSHTYTPVVCGNASDGSFQCAPPPCVPRGVIPVGHQCFNCCAGRCEPTSTQAGNRHPVCN
jgi:hypothetical protein